MLDRLGIPFEQKIAMGGKVEKEKSTVVVQKLDRGGKTRLDLGPNHGELTLDLDEVITSFYRSKNKGPLRDDLTTEAYYQANCRSATQDFGRLLAGQIGEDDERKFFERYPDAKYFDLETANSDKAGWGGFNFHSIGFLQITDPNSRKTRFVAIDLTNNANTQSDVRTLVVHGDNEAQVRQEIQKIYSNKNWTTYELNPAKGNYLYQD